VIELRRARIDDADELARLRWDFRTEAETPAVMGRAEFDEEFGRFASQALADPERWHVWVAEAEGRLVGCVWLQVVERVPHPGLHRGERPIAYITTMYVEPQLRDAGLGRALLEEAVRFARERGAGGAILWPSERARPFYERAGFGADGAPLGLEIEGD
jgi:GNAT superfamily N-acetyltransferase